MSRLPTDLLPPALLLPRPPAALLEEARHRAHTRHRERYYLVSWTPGVLSSDLDQGFLNIFHPSADHWQARCDFVLGFLNFDEVDAKIDGYLQIIFGYESLLNWHLNKLSPIASIEIGTCV